MDRIKLYFQQLKEKLAYRYFFGMCDEEARVENYFDGKMRKGLNC